MHETGDIRSVVETVYRVESRKALATLARLLGDLDLAEDALQIAFRAALEQWPANGVPANPFAWLVSTGRFKAIDRLRRRGMFQPLTDTELEAAVSDDDVVLNDVGDDQLRLIFMCCNQELSDDARIALTLREVCGLTTEEIAAAYLVTTSTVAQRIVRAKKTIRERRIPLELPSTRHLHDRLKDILRVIYLVFNEGYSATSGDTVVRVDLAGEAIRLGRLLVELLADSEAYGLLALMLLHDSRRRARTNRDGDLVRLEDQDRSLWDSEQIREGLETVGFALESGGIGAYTLQAAIAAEHARAFAFEHTDWDRIVTLYGMLLEIGHSPIVELNRAVAIAMRDGPEDGLHVVREMMAQGKLLDYHLTYATLGDLLVRAGDACGAIVEYRRALELANQTPERRFIKRRIKELQHEQGDNNERYGAG